MDDADRIVAAFNFGNTNSGNGIDVQAQPVTGAVITGNVVSNTTGYGFQGRSSASNRRVLVKSDNFFQGVAGAVNYSQLANVMGDQCDGLSFEFTANVASEHIVQIPRRPGAITLIRYCMITAPAGTTGDTIDIGFSGGNEILSAGSVQTAGKAQYSLTTINADDPEFSEDDVITIGNAGASDGAARYAVQIEYFEHF